MTKEKIIDTLANSSIVYSSEINCDKCTRVTFNGHRNKTEAAIDFYDKGWRATAYSTFCPECAKKYFKDKTK